MLTAPKEDLPDIYCDMDDNELIDVLRNPFEDFEDDNELLESGYMDNDRWIKRSSPENTRFLPRMDYGSIKKRS